MNRNELSQINDLLSAMNKRLRSNLEDIRRQYEPSKRLRLDSTSHCDFERDHYDDDESDYDESDDNESDDDESTNNDDDSGSNNESESSSLNGTAELENSFERDLRAASLISMREFEKEKLKTDAAQHNTCAKCKRVQQNLLITFEPCNHKLCCINCAKFCFFCPYCCRSVENKVISKRKLKIIYYWISIKFSNCDDSQILEYDQTGEIKWFSDADEFGFLIE